MIIMSKWNEWYGVHVKKWIFLEAGEAKTAVDSHHAQVCLNYKGKNLLPLNISNSDLLDITCN